MRGTAGCDLDEPLAARAVGDHALGNAFGEQRRGASTGSDRLERPESLEHRRAVRLKASSACGVEELVEGLVEESVEETWRGWDVVGERAKHEAKVASEQVLVRGWREAEIAGLIVVGEQRGPDEVVDLAGVVASDETQREQDGLVVARVVQALSDRGRPVACTGRERQRTTGVELFERQVRKAPAAGGALDQQSAVLLDLLGELQDPGAGVGARRFGGLQHTVIPVAAVEVCPQGPEHAQQVTQRGRSFGALGMHPVGEQRQPLRQVALVGQLVFGDALVGAPRASERVDDGLVGVDAAFGQPARRAMHEQQRRQQQRVGRQAPDARCATERVEQLTHRSLGVQAHERVGLQRRLATLDRGDIAAQKPLDRRVVHVEQSQRGERRRQRRGRVPGDPAAAQHVVAARALRDRESRDRLHHARALTCACDLVEPVDQHQAATRL